MEVVAYYFFVFIISTIVTYALTPKPDMPKAATLKDFDFPQAEEGTPQIVVFGDVWIDGWMVLTYGDLSTAPIYSDSGGKK